ncbi:MAG: hypothetical protein IPJ04_17930 [Candidatus Eisenbacteria bacterium]|nr:hypothetical protein [Candidatus Eisenbacteria bacterium]
MLSARAIAQAAVRPRSRRPTAGALAGQARRHGLAGSAIVQAMPHANGAVLALGLIVGGDTVDAMLYGGAVWRSRALTMVGSSVPAQSEPDYMQEAA